MDCAQEILMKKQADYMWKIIRKNEVGLFNMIYFYFAFCLCEFLLEFLLLLLLLFVLFFLFFFFIFLIFYTSKHLFKFQPYGTFISVYCNEKLKNHFLKLLLHM